MRERYSLRTDDSGDFNARYTGRNSCPGSHKSRQHSNADRVSDSCGGHVGARRQQLSEFPNEPGDIQLHCYLPGEFHFQLERRYTWQLQVHGGNKEIGMAQKSVSSASVAVGAITAINS
jgi:hypothetical protein